MNSNIFTYFLVILIIYELKLPNPYFTLCSRIFINLKLNHRIHNANSSSTFYFGHVENECKCRKKLLWDRGVLTFVTQNEVFM